MTSKIRYRDSKLIRIGGLLFLIGPGFLLAAYAMSRLMGDTQPNPVGPGLLAFVLFWPSVLFVATGALWTFKENRRAS